MGSTQTLHFRRVEIKYLIDRTQRTGLARDLAALMRPDLHAGTGGAYVVRSLYFDTPDYLFYHDKLAGAAARYKVRARTYATSPGQAAQVRLEVKARYLQTIHKTTVDVPRQDYGEVERAIRRRTLPALVRENENVSKEFFRLLWQYNLEPKVIVQYRRQAFERRETSRTRVSFDDELWATRHLDLLGPLSGARRVLQSGHGILELKVDGAVPYWMHMLIAKYELQNQAISKYCYAVRSEARMSAFGRSDDLVPVFDEQPVRRDLPWISPSAQVGEASHDI